MNKRIVGIIILNTICVLSFGQYQLNNNPLRLNPSFSGAKSDSRITGSFLYSPADGDYQKTINYGHLSYDKFIKGIRAGVGIYISRSEMNYREEIGYANYYYQTIGLSFAPKFLHFKYKAFPQLTFSPSANIDYNSYEKSFGCCGVDSVNNRSGYSIRLGLLANSDYYFLGITFRDLFFEKHNTFYTTIHGGFVFQKKPGSNFSFSPMFNVVFINPLKSPLENVRSKFYYYIEAANLNFRYKKIVFGTGLPVAMLGYQSDQFRLSITYNLKLNNNDSPFDWYIPRANWQLSTSLVLKNK